MNMDRNNPNGQRYMNMNQPPPLNPRNRFPGSQNRISIPIRNTVTNQRTSSKNANKNMNNSMNRMNRMNRINPINSMNSTNPPTLNNTTNINARNSSNVKNANMLDPSNKNAPINVETKELNRQTNSTIIRYKIIPVYRNVIHRVQNRSDRAPSFIEMWKLYAALRYFNNMNQRARLHTMNTRCDIENYATKQDLIGFYGFLKYLPPWEIQKFVS